MNLQDYIAEAFRVSPHTAALHAFMETDLDTFYSRYHDVIEFINHMKKCAVTDVVMEAAEEQLERFIVDVDTEDEVKKFTPGMKVRIGKARYGEVEMDKGMFPKVEGCYLADIEPQPKFVESTKKRLLLNLIQFTSSEFLGVFYDLVSSQDNQRLYETYERHVERFRDLVKSIQYKCEQSPDGKLTRSEVRAEILLNDLSEYGVTVELILYKTADRFDFNEISRGLIGKVNTPFFGTTYLYGVVNGKTSFLPRFPITTKSANPWYSSLFLEEEEK